MSVKRREREAEATFRDQVKAYGGIYIKLNPMWNLGIPDRLILMPGPVIWFVELKKDDRQNPSTIQKLWGKRLTALGCNYLCAHDLDVLRRKILGVP